MRGPVAVRLMWQHSHNRLGAGCKRGPVTVRLMGSESKGRDPEAKVSRSLSLQFQIQSQAQGRTHASQYRAADHESNFKGKYAI